MGAIIVGVLRGGPSPEYDVSLKTGTAILQNLREEHYKTRDIFIDRAGNWHIHGVPVSPERALRGVDVVFNALHGEYGEDGTVQKILEAHSVPYTGSNPFASAAAYNKAHTYRAIKDVPGIKVPQFVVVYKDKEDSALSAAQKVFAQFGPQYVLKPTRGGSSLGIKVARTLYELADALDELLEAHEAVVVQQYVHGKEATCGVINGFRGEDTYTLPPIEIRKDPAKGIWDYDSKYDDSTEEVCPGNFTKAETAAIRLAAQRVHEALGIRHYSRSDFIVAPSGVYFLEINNLPGLAPSCLMPKAFDAVGTTYADFLDHVVTLAIQHK